MPISDHLKVAAAELKKGAELLKQEIDALRNEEHQLRSALEKQVVVLQQEIRLHNDSLRNLGGDGDADRVRSTIRDLDVRISQSKQQLQREQARIQDLIREKEQMISQLQIQSNNLMP